MVNASREHEKKPSLIHNKKSRKFLAYLFEYTADISGDKKYRYASRHFETFDERKTKKRRTKLSSSVGYTPVASLPRGFIFDSLFTLRGLDQFPAVL